MIKPPIFSKPSIKSGKSVMYNFTVYLTDREDITRVMSPTFPSSHSSEFPGKVGKRPNTSQKSLGAIPVSGIFFVKYTQILAVYDFAPKGDTVSNHVSQEDTLCPVR